MHVVDDGPGRTTAPPYAVKACSNAFVRKASRQELLMVGKDVHCKCLRLDQQVMHGGHLLDTYKNERGFQRNRTERADGHAMWYILRITRGDNGNAAGKAA